MLKFPSATIFSVAYLLSKSTTWTDISYHQCAFHWANARITSQAMKQPHKEMIIITCQETSVRCLSMFTPMQQESLS
jgi:hypothetical protein